MNKIFPVFSAVFVLGLGCARAQWITETYALRGGWNAIQLHGAASGTPETVFGAGDGARVEEVWRWNPNPTEVQFTTTPLIPSPGTPEWSVWKRGFPLESNLSDMNGGTAYLVKCSGAASDRWTVPLKLSPQTPAAAWLRTGANLLGFPALGNGSTPPVFSNYFATFPAAIAPSTEIYKYVGGELGEINPLQILSPATEPLDRHTAYWFNSSVVANFYAPVEISAAGQDGLDFGRSGATRTLRVTNRSASPVTVSFSPVNSESAPAGQPAVAGAVPLTRRNFNAITAAWTEVPLPAASSEVIPPSGTVEIHLGLNRGAMSTTADTFYASILRFTDSGNLVDLAVPVRAQSGSLSGLWLGEALVTSVQNQAKFTAAITSSINSDGSVTALTLKSQGLGYTGDRATVTVAPPPAGGIPATASAVVSQGVVTSVVLTSAGSGYRQAPAITVAPPANPPGGAATDRPAPLRVILHIDSSGRARVLSQVFLGKLAATGTVGLCTRERHLKQDDKGGASRILATHMPMDREIAASGGALAVMGATLNCTVTVPFDDNTNPFVHPYHPDHDNRNARGQPVGNKVESHTITRAMSLELTTAPPGGAVVSGWGSSIIGGRYTEVLTGLHRNPLVVTGTFELRRISELGAITMD